MDTSRILFGGKRLGAFYLEKGASQRPSKVIYDREYSAVSLAEAGEYDWREILEDCTWFHFSGITPALSAQAAQTCLDACRTLSANDNFWSGMVYDGQMSQFSREYAIHIVDRVGGGDSFAAGYIFAQVSGMPTKDSVEFAIAASCLKHSIEGDYAVLSLEGVDRLAHGNASGRVKR